MNETVSEVEHIIIKKTCFIVGGHSTFFPHVLDKTVPLEIKD